jgi:hypothetical protein
MSSGSLVNIVMVALDPKKGEDDVDDLSHGQLL